MFSRLAVAAQPLQWLPGAVPGGLGLTAGHFGLPLQSSQTGFHVTASGKAAGRSVGRSQCVRHQLHPWHPSVMPQGAPGPHSEPSQPTQSPATLPHWGRRLEPYAAADWQCFYVSIPIASRFFSAERSPLAVLKPEVLELQSGANHRVVSLHHC